MPMLRLLRRFDGLMENQFAERGMVAQAPDQPGALEIARTFAGELIPQVQVCFGR